MLCKIFESQDPTRLAEEVNKWLQSARPRGEDVKIEHVHTSAVSLQPDGHLKLWFIITIFWTNARAKT